jgi:hypothetical protein
MKDKPGLVQHGVIRSPLADWETAPEPSEAAQSYRRTGTALNEAVTAYAALILSDGLTGWKYDKERQQVLCCMYRLSVFATGGSVDLRSGAVISRAETDRAVITAAIQRLIARDISLPLTAQEFEDLGVQE